MINKTAFLECRKKNCPAKLIKEADKYKLELNTKLESIKKKIITLRDAFVASANGQQASKKEISEYFKKLNKLREKIVQLKSKKIDNKYISSLRKCALPNCQTETRKVLQAIKDVKCDDSKTIKKQLSIIIAKPIITNENIVKYHNLAKERVKRQYKPIKYKNT